MIKGHFDGVVRSGIEGVDREFDRHFRHTAQGSVMSLTKREAFNEAML